MRWRADTGLRAAAFCGLAALGLFTASCASTAPPGGSPAQLQAAARLRGFDPDAVVVPFRVGEAERAWLARTLPEEEIRGMTDRRRLELLLERLEDERGILYRRGSTGTARETFERRTANCLGFMNLFIGLARELDLSAYYVLVEDQPLYSREGDLVVSSDHVAAGFGPVRDMLLLDFSRDRATTYRQLFVLTDLQATAKYYSNKGAELVQAGEIDAALPWLEDALRLAPELAPSWVNAGVARRRDGDLAGAESAYGRALELDPELASAYHNLAGLLRVLGRVDEAEALMAVLRRVGGDNPFSYLSLGDWSAESGRVDEARRYYERALELARDEAEPYAALGELELARGRDARAERWLRRARKRSPDDPRTARLAARLAERAEEPPPG